jgi:hypothetical protein
MMSHRSVISHSSLGHLWVILQSSFSHFSAISYPSLSHLTTNKIVQSFKPESEEKKNGFVYRSVLEWNLLPVEIRNIGKIENFRIELKKWIKENVEI